MKQVSIEPSFVNQNVRGAYCIIAECVTNCPGLLQMDAQFQAQFRAQFR